MTTRSPLALLVALCASAPVLAQEPPKLVVVPFAALSGDVPPRAGSKAAGMLSVELRNTEKVDLLDVKRAAGADGNQELLVKARAAVTQAQELRSKRKFRLSEEALTRALADYKAGAGGLMDIGELVDAYALLSAVQYNTGKDDEGAKSLNTALALAPAREVPLVRTSPLFTRVVADARKALLAAPKGSVLLESVPSNAPVTVDGVALGSTPLLVKDVPPGTHLWRAALATGEQLGGVVEVAAGKQAKVSIQTRSKEPEARLVASLSQNRLDEPLVAAAREQAKAAQADLLLFGALSKDGKGLALDSFVFSAATGEVKRLPRTAFDAELLSATTEFFNLAGQVAQKGITAGEKVKVPGPVLSGGLASASKVAEVRYGVEAGKEPSLDEPATQAEPDTANPRAPLDPTKKRAPLKRK